MSPSSVVPPSLLIHIVISMADTYHLISEGKHSMEVGFRRGEVVYKLSKCHQLDNIHVEAGFNVAVVFFYQCLNICSSSLRFLFLAPPLRDELIGNLLWSNVRLDSFAGSTKSEEDDTNQRNSPSASILHSGWLQMNHYSTLMY